MTQHIFLHVPKTAGSSVRTLLQQNYPADRALGFSGDPEPLAWYSSRTPAYKRHYRLLHGHVPYGVHAGLTDYLYFTFLREPVARHFSDFDFLRRYEAHPLQRDIASGRISLADWTTIFDRYPSFANRMTRFISGDGDSRTPDRLSLETAKLHLRREFGPVGLAERFDESILVLAKRLRWKSIFYLTKNVTPRPSEITPDLRSRAMPGLALDAELYAFATRLFEESPELHDPAFGPALKEFRDVQAWLESNVSNDRHQQFVVGGHLPTILDIVLRHRTTPALDLYFERPLDQAA